MIIGLIVVLAGCSASKEMETYFSEVHEDVMKKNAKVEAATAEFIDAVVAQEPAEAMDILKGKVIPLNEAVLEKLQHADVTEDDLVVYNDMSKEVVQLNLDKHIHMKDFFEKIVAEKEGDSSKKVDIDANMQKLFDINEQHIEASIAYREKMEEVSEESESVKLDEDAIAFDVNDIDVDEVNDEYEALVMTFMDSFGEASSGERKDAPAVDADILADQGNPEVMFDGKVTIDESFKLQGKSNLPEGAVLQMKTYEYGTENPYFKGDIVVAADGSFAVEADVDDAALDGELLVVRLAYIPDNKENVAGQSVYGTEGEKLEGNFIHPYTDIKRTRNGAFAYAYLELEKGTEAPLEADVWGAKPDDYGDLDVWMKVVHVDTHDNYYDISMESNLQQLTQIKAQMEVPGYTFSGFRSSTKVLPDGSFRFQIPRPDVDNDEVMVVIHAQSDHAIETEKQYGENGENFAGDLAVKTKKGKQIEYKLKLGNDD
jgi:hypothetical protein